MQFYTVYLYLETALHVSGGTSTHHQERIQLYLQHLVSVRPLLLLAAIVEGLKKTRNYISFSEECSYLYAINSILHCCCVIIFNLHTAAFKAYCEIWIRRSNFRHQASPRLSPRESTQRRKVELCARNVRKFCLNADLNVTFRDLLHAVKLRHGTDGFTSPPKEGVLRISFALKI